MEIVYLLVPLSVGLALLVIGVFAWALQSRQFEDLEREGQRIFEDPDGERGRAAAPDPERLDRDQG